MIKPEQIPDAVIDAAVEMRDRGGSMSDIIRTALNAWPGAAVCHYTIGDDEGYEMVLPLPFPQETRDDE